MTKFILVLFKTHRCTTVAYAGMREWQGVLASGTELSHKLAMNVSEKRDVPPTPLSSTCVAAKNDGTLGVHM